MRDAKTERLRELIEELVGEAESDAQGVQDIWKEETLQTMSLFIEHEGDNDYLVWYFETESIERLIEAREASTHPLHDIEDALMEEVLVDPEEAGDFEPLLHGVSPKRKASYHLQQFI